MKIIYLKRSIVTVAMLVMSSGLALPQALAKGACRADVEKFCQNVEPGEGRIRECLKQHMNELSPECKTHCTEMEQRHQACRADKEKFCKDVPHGKGNIKKCLHDHLNELSSECRAAKNWGSR